MVSLEFLVTQSTVGSTQPLTEMSRLPGILPEG